MTKQVLIATFCANHQTFMDYINSLTDDELVSSFHEKWTAAQQLSHVYLCLLPFPKVLAAKAYILQKFGKINRTIWDYDMVIEQYLQTSLKAPLQFLPEQVGSEQKTKISADLQEILSVIRKLLNEFTDEELDSLVIPHPLLGNLTIREMFYLMSYHPLHHLEQTRKNLEAIHSDNK